MIKPELNERRAYVSPEQKKVEAREASKRAYYNNIDAKRQYYQDNKNERQEYQRQYYKNKKSQGTIP
jgi:hypothetical protein